MYECVRLQICVYAHQTDSADGYEILQRAAEFSQLLIFVKIPKCILSFQK